MTLAILVAISLITDGFSASRVPGRRFGHQNFAFYAYILMSSKITFCLRYFVCSKPDVFNRSLTFGLGCAEVTRSDAETRVTQELADDHQVGAPTAQCHCECPA